MRNTTLLLAISGFIALALAFLLVRGMFAMPDREPDHTPFVDMPSGPPPEGLQKAIFGAGCFWCSEAVFQQLKGVKAVVPGYSGGSVKNPTYEQVCTGTTGHAEVIQITYDPKVISFVDLLEVFWRTHNPTTRNRQGDDVGTQYRSVVFYHDKDQKDLAEQYKQKLDAAGAFDAAIVTEIAAFSAFFPAEAYHHNFYLNNPRQAYCAAVIRPKLEKFEKVFKDKLKSPAPK
jgi:peptide-methionine (S)-S-oxide reductase